MFRFRSICQLSAFPSASCFISSESFIKAAKLWFLRRRPIYPALFLSALRRLCFPWVYCCLFGPWGSHHHCQTERLLCVNIKRCSFRLVFPGDGQRRASIEGPSRKRGYSSENLQNAAPFRNWWGNGSLLQAEAKSFCLFSLSFDSW